MSAPVQDQVDALRAALELAVEELKASRDRCAEEQLGTAYMDVVIEMSETALALTQEDL